MSPNPQILFDHLTDMMQAQANPTLAKPMSAYLKNRFTLLGIRSPTRKEVIKPFYCEFKKELRAELIPFVHLCWQSPYRELQYCGMDILGKTLSSLEKKDISDVEQWITHKSWWDTVDFLASTVVGHLLKKYPELRESHAERWIASDNMWLQRSAIIFQLKYKDQMDIPRLERYILSTIGSKEFFINKATGWALRQLSRYEPTYVEEFVAAHPELSGLTKREAVRLLG